MANEAHYSVLLAESVDALITDTSGVYVDGTFGRGGHTQTILSRLAGDASLIGFDKDPEAIDVAKGLHEEDERFSFVHDSFASIERVLTAQCKQASGILLDLGVSSPQLDDAARGFSFMRDGPLDMRMNNTDGVSAEEWVATVDEREMVRVFKEYGEERFAKRIARCIIERRQEERLNRTLQLANIISEAVPFKEEGKHPATRVFQAIRIEVNQELEDLKRALAASLTSLKPGGRLVVISFHSLEDRIVKRFFRKYSQSLEYPIGVPVTHDKLKAPLKIIGKAAKAGREELAANVRSRSAVMRIAERTDWCSVDGVYA